MIKITIEGNIGEGKTTIAKLIEQSLTSKGLTYKSLYGEEDIIKLTTPIKQLYKPKEN